jgi:hypothetical protein
MEQRFENGEIGKAESQRVNVTLGVCAKTGVRFEENEPKINAFRMASVRVHTLVFILASTILMQRQIEPKSGMNAVSGIPWRAKSMNLRVLLYEKKG